MEIDTIPNAADSLRSDGSDLRSGATRGGMRARVDAFDWSRTPLGPRPGWPAELEFVVQQILDSSFPKAVVWGERYTTIYNDAFLPILGAKPDALGRSFAEVWSEAWDSIGPIAERAYAGIPTYIEDFPLLIDRSGRKEQAWFTFCYSPLRLADGTIGGMLDTVIETTGKMRAQADLALANQELGHRLKNSLALVQAIAAQTLRDAVQPQAIEAFSSRLAALGHAHDILLRQEWSMASLSQILAASIEPHDALRQVTMEGPDFQVSSRAAVALSLMLHELATNAVKYGALSTPSGRILMAWRVEADHLHLTWQESGGPPVQPPTRTGFGSRLIDMGLGGRSEVRRHYRPEGLTIEIGAPLPELVN